MTRLEFENLEITRQEEMVERNGNFVQTQTIGSYICDTYRYDSFFVLFYCLIAKPGESNSRCFDHIEHVEHFINAIDRPMS